MISKVYNIDCLEYMQSIPDKFFDLAIVDPPYGINASEMSLGKGKKKKFTQGKGWDKQIPTKDYFDELFRISVNQIIWGGNYFNLPQTRCFIIWDKNNYGRDFADCEFAYTSFNSVARIYKQRPQNMDGGKIHPTQKPVDLYKWLLHNYAKKGDKIFDSHMGSQSSRLAAWDMGFDYYGCELDKDYFKEGCKRFDEFKLQLKMF